MLIMDGLSSSRLSAKREQIPRDSITSSKTDQTVQLHSDRLTSQRIELESEPVRLDDLIGDNGKEILTQELINRRTSPNRLGTRMSAQFVEDAITPTEAEKLKLELEPVKTKDHSMFVKTLKKQVRPEAATIANQETQNEIDERFAGLSHDTEVDLDDRFSQVRRKSEGFMIKQSAKARFVANEISQEPGEEQKNARQSEQGTR